MKVKKLLSTGTATAVLLAVGAGSAFATLENVGGGTWDYGKANGTVYSNYYHPSKVHRSSVKVGSTTTRSQCTDAGKWSRISAGTSIWSSEQAYWAYC